MASLGRLDWKQIKIGARSAKGISIGSNNGYIVTQIAVYPVQEVEMYQKLVILKEEKMSWLTVGEGGNNEEAFVQSPPGE